MEMQWSASLEHENERRKRDLNLKHSLRWKTFAILILFFFGMTPGGGVHCSSAWATEKPQEKRGEVEQRSPVPEFEIELLKPVQNKAAFKVGDAIELVIPGIRVPAIQSPFEELEFDHPPGEKSLEELGWGIEKKPSREVFLLSATPLKPGPLILPPLLLKDKGGKGVAQTKPFEIQVASAISDKDPRPDQIESPEPPVSLQFPGWILMILILFAAGLLAGMGYGIYQFIHRKKKEPIALSPVIRPADEIALEQLEQLQKLGFIDRGEFKKYYFSISEILKAYLGARYRFDALESTTYEIMIELERKVASSDRVLNQVEGLFKNLDRVKFTDHYPEVGEPSAVFTGVKELILLTRIQPQEVSGNAPQ